jgi:hypothetical protein
MHAQAIGEGITRNHRRDITKKIRGRHYKKKKTLLKRRKKHKKGWGSEPYTSLRCLFFFSSSPASRSSQSKGSLIFTIFPWLETAEGGPPSAYPRNLYRAEHKKKGHLPQPKHTLPSSLSPSTVVTCKTSSPHFLFFSFGQYCHHLDQPVTAPCNNNFSLHQPLSARLHPL